MIEVRIGKKSYELDSDGQPVIPPGKYPPGDCRRLGPQYVRFQRGSRAREERRSRLTEHAKKAGFKSLAAMLFSQRKTGGERAPKHEGRTKALKHQSATSKRVRRSAHV